MVCVKVFLIILLVGSIDLLVILSPNSTCGGWAFAMFLTLVGIIMIGVETSDSGPITEAWGDDEEHYGPY